tara:strand:- start:7067 stop:7405 length:339 start_codon:yes stop_codon:yes gene_type:complete
MLVDQARNRVRDLIASDIYEGQFGTGTTAPQPTDTALETAVTGTNSSLSTTKFDKQLIFTHSLANTEGNGNTMTEFALTMNSGSTLLTRDIVDGTPKDITKSFQTSILIFVE